MTRRRWWRRWPVLVMAALALILLAAGGIAVVQNDYDIDEERVSIPFGDIVLDGVLATPSGGERPVGLVVFVLGRSHRRHL